MPQIERLYWIDQQIRAAKYPNADSVQEKFEVSRRTAYADRDLLKEHLNAPLEYDYRNKGWTYTDPTYILPFLAMTEKESSALSRALDAAIEYLPPDDSAAVAHLITRLGPNGGALPRQAWHSAGGGIRPTTDVSVSAKLLDDCVLAIKQHNRLEIAYHGAHRGVDTERIIHPYHLHNYQGDLHLLAWCELRNSVRQFCLGRIKECKRLIGNDAFTVDPDFDAETYLAQGLDLLHGDQLIDVRLRFTPWQARWIRERVHHPSQTLTELNNGGVELTLRVAGTSEILRWIRSYGTEVEVIEPIELRLDIINSAKKILEIYGE